MKKKKYLKPHSRIFSVNAQVLSGGSNTPPGNDITIEPDNNDIENGDAGARGGLFFDTDDSEW